MKILSVIGAALLGLSSAIGVAITPVAAENLQVVRKGTARDLNVAVNRAVVVESDLPFAELSIANPAIADFSTLSDRTIYLLGKTPGRTTLTLLDAGGQLITNVEVRVTTDISEFKERLSQILPNESIEVRSANDGIVLSGSVSSTSGMQRALDLAERYAPERVSNLMTVSGKQQVMLKVRFAEMQRSVSKQLSTSIGISDLGSDFRTNGERPELSRSRKLCHQSHVEHPARCRGRHFLRVRYRLHPDRDPSGSPRKQGRRPHACGAEPDGPFGSGGEIPRGWRIPVPVAQENDQITIEFKPFGVELNFVPRVMDDGVINLELAAAVSSLDPSNSITATGGFEIDAFRRRDASTTVALRDGESFAIAGLLQDDFRDTSGQVPWLGDVPVLGALFRSADYLRAQTELVIIISAHLVTPTRGEALALPTDRVRLPTEKELFLNGRVAIDKSGAQAGGAGEVAKQDFNGSYGYVMD